MGEYGAVLDRIAVFVEENKTWICMGKIYLRGGGHGGIMLGLPGGATVANDISNILTAVCGEP